VLDFLKQWAIHKRRRSMVLAFNIISEQLLDWQSQIQLHRDGEPKVRGFDLE
jgi:hypothetical protein